MIINDTLNTMLKAPVRQHYSRVEVYNASALEAQYTQDDNLVSYSISRTGEDKFFGFGVCHKLSLVLLDSNRAINISTANTIKIYIGDSTELINPFPLFYVSEVRRNENDNTLSITAYDALYDAAEHITSEIELVEYTINDFIGACAAILGVTFTAIDDAAFNLSYPDGANYEGVEPLRTALNQAAEATQTIYYINNENQIVFKRLNSNTEPLYLIDKENYITLDNSDNKRLGRIISATTLGDNVEAATTQSGSTQIIRDNAFLEMREDIGDIIEAAIVNVGGLTINQFNCQWRGNYLIEVGDYISLQAKDNSILNTFLLNDELTYNGALIQTSSWKYGESAETIANPASIGDALNQTYARVDKVNKQVDIVVGETETIDKELSTLKLNTNSIATSVKEIKTTTDGAISKINSDLSILTNTVETKTSSEDVTIAIKKEMANGVSKVVTTTGFVFDDNGITIDKSDSEMSTNINEDGLSVYKDNEEVLTADNTGVLAINLTSKQYLIVGNSRFEDYGSDRTGCYWIG